MESERQAQDLWKRPVSAFSRATQMSTTPKITKTTKPTVRKAY